MKRGTSVVLAGFSVVAATVFVYTNATSAQGAARRAPFKPVSSVPGLMGGQGMVFGQLQKAITTRNMDQRHARIEVMAEVLAELSNVNQYHASKDDYATWARELRDAALELSAEAAKGTSADDGMMRRSLRTMKSRCGACHDVYQQ